MTFEQWAHQALFRALRISKSSRGYVSTYVGVPLALEKVSKSLRGILLDTETM